MLPERKNTTFPQFQREKRRLGLADDTELGAFGLGDDD